MKHSSREIQQILEERKYYLEKTLKAARKQDEKSADLLLHKIRIQKHGKSFQYYLRSEEKDAVGRYMKKEQEGLVKQVFQKEYIQKSIKLLQNELTMVSRYLEKASPLLLEEYYAEMNEGRKRLIEALEFDEKEYVQLWQGVPYEGKEFPLNAPEYYTQRGERVRSKSEIIIANTLNQCKIPYRYEYPIQVKGMGRVYPDFTVLNVRKRKEMYWEHFGLIDDLEYRENALRKMTYYEKNDLFVGDRLIVTCESTEQPLNVREIERKIEKYLL